MGIVALNALVSLYFAPLLRLNQILLTQFKNYSQAQFAFAHKVTGICGLNGRGKTNLLDAIYYLCFTKSYFTHTDAQVQQRGHAGFRLQGEFIVPPAGSPVTVTAVYREQGRKEVSWQGEVYERLAAHVGKLPAVLIAPDDVAIITGGSEERRRLVDGLLCQLDAAYLQSLMEYNKLLQQRNSLLKQMAGTEHKNYALLEILDRQMATRALYVWQQRQQCLHGYLAQAMQHYQAISGGAEPLQISYQTGLAALPATATPDDYALWMQQSRPKDLLLQRTTQGIHRDDLEFSFLGAPFKQIASQGQRKSLLFALKLTEFEWLQNHKGTPPLLLLDDVFEKLDHQRMHNLLQEVCVQKAGQVFITDTHAQRLTSQLSALGADFGLVEV
ncbi:MAG TPA: DNA replication and repair protein RecF [Phnomibacter sp.]|nr:DNA replication and repair protein RecF [Phnomibacter sp.]